jgi:hypothetical protein
MYETVFNLRLWEVLDNNVKLYYFCFFYLNIFCLNQNLLTGRKSDLACVVPISYQEIQSYSADVGIVLADGVDTRWLSHSCGCCSQSQVRTVFTSSLSTGQSNYN